MLPQSSTPVVTLRAIALPDLDAFFEFHRDPVAVSMAAFTSKDPDDRAAFDAHWSRILDDPTGPVRTVLADGSVAGSVLSYVDDDGPEVSYWIDRHQWGRGVASTALGLFLAEFTDRPLRARVVKDNIASLRVLQRHGFVIVGEDRGFANGRGAEVEEYLLTLDG